jgi:glycosyltransferase involved in cell wall biosynthesis
MKKGQLTLILLTDGIPPYVMGGMQKHSKLLSEYVARLGVKVVLYHCVENEAQLDNESVKRTFSESARFNIQVRTFLYQDLSNLPGHYLRAQKQLSKAYFDRLLTEETAPDFIYIKGFVGSELLRRRNELPYQCKIGVKFHGMNMFQKQPNWQGEVIKYMLRPSVRNILNDADVVFSYGGKITRIIARYISKPSKIVEFPSGIASNWIRNVSELEPSQNELHFLFVGRYDRLKGLPELYKALGFLIGQNWKITIVGPIPEKDQFTHPKLQFIGPVYEEEELKRIYDGHHVLLCPSISEGMPNVIMEAMARGLAIIATDVGATQVLVDGENGWLIPPGDIKAIGLAVSAVIETIPNQLENMRKVSIERMQNNFVWEEIAGRFVKWLEVVKD